MIKQRFSTLIKKKSQKTTDYVDMWPIAISVFNRSFDLCFPMISDFSQLSMQTYFDDLSLQEIFSADALLVTTLSFG